MKKHQTKIEWLETPMGNFIIETDWGRVSYNPSVRPSIFDFFQPSAGLEETALCIDGIEGGGFAVLNGDYRKEYEKAFPDLEACKNVFRKNVKHNSEWSSEDLVEKIINKQS